VRTEAEERLQAPVEESTQAREEVNQVAADSYRERLRIAVVAASRDGRLQAAVQDLQSAWASQMPSEEAKEETAMEPERAPPAVEETSEEAPVETVIESKEAPPAVEETTQEAPEEAMTEPKEASPAVEETTEERVDDEPALAIPALEGGMDEQVVVSPTSLKRVGVYDDTPRWSIVEDSLEDSLGELAEEPLELEPAHSPECLKALTSYNELEKAKKAIHALGRPMESALRLRLERSRNAVDGEDHIELERRLLQQEEARDTALTNLCTIMRGIDAEHLSDQTSESLA
jgi:hypothetical protein